MRLVIQRVTEASVVVDANETGRIGAGFLVLVGIARDDTVADARALAAKTVQLRLFPNDAGGSIARCWMWAARRSSYGSSP